MANYFRHFPKTPYILENKGDLNLATNIIARIKFIDTIKNISSSYFGYDIANDDTPETLSYKFYGTSTKHWVILLMNDVIDPQFDWYMNYETLNKYIEEKYYPQAIKSINPTFSSGLEFSQNTNQNFSQNKKYYIQEERQILELGSDSKITDTRETDFTTWQSVTIPDKTQSLDNGYTLRIVTNKFFKNFYELELEENEKKRSVKILRKEYVRRVEEELKNLLGTG
jgi:hypothetical protein